MRLSEKAELLWVRAWAHAKHYATDGLVTREWLHQLAPVGARSARKSAAVLAGELVAHGLWEAAADDFVILDWFEWNLPVEQEEEQREANRKGARLTNHKLHHQKQPQPNCEHCTTSLGRTVEPSLERDAPACADPAVASAEAEVEEEPDTEKSTGGEGLGEGDAMAQAPGSSSTFAVPNPRTRSEPSFLSAASLGEEPLDPLEARARFDELRRRGNLPPSKNPIASECGVQ